MKSLKLLQMKRMVSCLLAVFMMLLTLAPYAQPVVAAGQGNIDIIGFELPKEGGTTSLTLDADIDGVIVTAAGASWYEKDPQIEDSGYSRLNAGDTAYLYMWIEVKANAEGVIVPADIDDWSWNFEGDDEVTILGTKAFVYDTLGEGILELYGSYTVGHDYLTEIAEVPSTCTAAGKKSYYHCDKCGMNFEDEAATRAVTDLSTLSIQHPHEEPYHETDR